MMDVTCRKVIEKQIEYAFLKTCLGGYRNPAITNLIKLNYQYRVFGVPASVCGRILKILGHRSLCLLYRHALAVYRAYDNMHRLREYAEKIFRFMKPWILWSSQKHETGMQIDQSYMIHHQGMTLAALTIF